MTQLRFGNRLVVFLVAAAIGARTPSLAQAPPPKSSPQLTVNRLREAGWWPTKGDAVRKSYVGSEACAVCHREISLAQRQTSMAKAASKAYDTAVLRANSKISFDAPPFLTEITRDRKGSVYTVGRGGEAMTGPILWTMGDGSMGQTFILESGPSLFESQLSYFSSIRGLDLTPGHAQAATRDVEGAFGQRQSEATARQCFGCHTTGSSVRGRFDPMNATPGIACEACHGPGGAHAGAMAQGNVEAGKAAILNPSSFDPARLVDYCGACHRTPMDVAAAKDFVPINVRFQPYRLEKSRCWSRPDPRIACTGCHDPHEQVVKDATFYDVKCLACHAAKSKSVETIAKPSQESAHAGSDRFPVCPVSASHCTSCHMPRYEVPAMHGVFTDHDIRIVRPGEPYPL